MQHFNRRQIIIGAGMACLATSSPARGQLAVGFIFVAASWCPFCKLAAPVIYDIAAEERLVTLVVSKDNAPIPPFETFVSASGHPIADAIEAIPALLIYAPVGDQIIARIDGFKSAANYRSRLVATLREAVRQGYVEAS